MANYKYDFGGDEDLERRYVEAIKRALDHTFRQKQLAEGEPMTAYELADDLAFKHITGDDSGAYRIKLQDMLRQQAEHIAELEKRPAINKEDGLVCAKCFERIGK